ncbi:MAG: CHASE2 domain-containing protein, partial [Arenimonas sp.]
MLALVAGTLPGPDESLLSDAERVAFDGQMRLLREIRPRPLGADVVLVGIDEGTEAAFTEPIALWHRHFAEALHALATASPRAVGVDIALPERSFDAIVPGLDLAMMRALFDLRRTTHLVFVQNLNSKREVVPVQPNYGRIMQPENLGLDQQERDPDGGSRRFAKYRDQKGRPVPTLASQVLSGLELPVDEGYIDYSLGAPLDYIPMHRVREMDAVQLRQAFGGRVVLVGSLIGTTDRWRLPVKLLARDPGRGADAGKLLYEQPGVLIHLQVLRTLLHTGMLHPVPELLRWLLCAVAALAVFVHARPAFVIAGAMLVPAALLSASLAAVLSLQLLLPVASIVFCFWAALVVRGVFDAIEAPVDRLRLQQTFAGQVSPAVMKEMLGGSLTAGVSGQLADICVLFSDVRDFTTLSE